MKSPPEGKRDVPTDPAVADVEWYLGLEGELTGPMEMEALARRLARCPPGADVLVWREGIEDWVEPGALPETADLYQDEGLSPGARDERDTSRAAGPEELDQFLQRAEARSHSSGSAGPPLLQPVLPPATAPAVQTTARSPEPDPAPRARRPRPAPRAGGGSRWAVLLAVAVVLLCGLGLLLVDWPDEVVRDEPRVLPSLPAVKATPPPPVGPVVVHAAKAPAPRPAPRPPVVTKPPPTPRRTPKRPAAAAPGEEPLPQSREGKRRWLTDVQGQIRELRKKRGALLRQLAEADQQPEALAKKREELRQMRYRVVTAHKLRGRLLEALAVGAPPLPQPP